MSQTMTERIKVKQLSKFGFQTFLGEYVNWGTKLAESERGKVVPGGDYEFTLFVSDGGKKYVNAVKELPMPVVRQATPAETVRFVKAEKTAEKTEKAAVDWDKKDRSQLIGGLSHDAAQMASTLAGLNGTQNADEMLESYKLFLVGMLKIRDEVR